VSRLSLAQETLLREIEEAGVPLIGMERGGGRRMRYVLKGLTLDPQPHSATMRALLQSGYLAEVTAAKGSVSRPYWKHQYEITDAGYQALERGPEEKG
jgi:hypothetical protein